MFCGKYRVILLILMLSTVCLADILQPGDVLDILVSDHPELTKTVIIKEDGTIDYPLFEDKPISEMSTDEVRELLTFRLAKNIENPFVIISKTKDVPILVRVLGQVAKPGMVKLIKGATLQEVINASGGPTDFANLVSIKIIREKGSDADALYVNYRDFLEKGELSVLPEIRHNDTVILLAAPRNLKVKILGSVSKPGYYSIQGQTNLFDAIYLAGGPAEKADLSRVRHILKDGEKDVDQVVDLQRYIDKGNMDDIPLVNEGDVIIVYKRFFSWSVFLNIVRDTVMIFTAYKVLTAG